MTQPESTLNPQEALRLVDLLTQEAKRASCEAVQEILLVAGCEIANLILQEEGDISAAA